MQKTFFVVAIAAAVAIATAGLVGAPQQDAGAVSVFVEGSTVSSFSGAGGDWGGYIGGTTEPQTIEVMKQMGRFCPQVDITVNREAADYLVLHERQSGGTWGGNRNNIAVFAKTDLLIYANGATKLDNAVKDMCAARLFTPAQ